jgi:hypothetical protein
MKYHSPSIRRLSLLVASHITVCLWGVTSALGVTLPPPLQGFVLGPKIVNPAGYPYKNPKT